MQNCGTAVTQEGRHRCELQTDSEVSKGSREQKAAPWSAGDYTGPSRRADGHTERGELGRTLKRRVSEAGNSSGDTRKKAGLGSPVREVWTWCREPRCVLEPRVLCWAGVRRRQWAGSWWDRLDQGRIQGTTGEEGGILPCSSSVVEVLPYSALVDFAIDAQNWNYLLIYPYPLINWQNLF